MAAAGVTMLGADARGWKIIQVEGHRPGEPERIFKMKVGDKNLEIVQQEETMNVYVNPDPEGPDDWEKPPGSGRILKVFNPKRGN